MSSVDEEVAVCVARVRQIESNSANHCLFTENVKAPLAARVPGACGPSAAWHAGNSHCFEIFVRSIIGGSKCMPQRCVECCAKLLL